MAGGSRRGARTSSPVRPLLLWSLPALAVALGILLVAGVDPLRAVGGCLGLLALLGVVYVLDRTGAMRPPPPDGGAPGRRSRSR